MELASALPAGVTIGADKGYDTQAFVAALRSLGVTPHVAQNTSHRSSAIDGRTTRHPGYRVSQQKRKLIEEVFGWLKTVGLLRASSGIAGRAAWIGSSPLPPRSTTSCASGT